MLTPDQLAAIKARYSTSEPLDHGVILRMHGDLLIVLADHERLTCHNQRMSAALAQLSDSENWTGEWWGPDHAPISPNGFNNVWIPDTDPQQLAERALVEDE